MTFITRLKATTIAAGRVAIGTALGLGLVAALVGGLASRAFAQDATPTAPVTAPAVRPVLPAPGAGPALWVIKDADSTLYLFGTIHILRPTTAWGSAKVDAAFDSASDVWFEISNPDDVAAIVPLFQQYGRADAGTPLSSLISSGQLGLLDNAGRTVNLTIDQLNGMKPWMAGILLSVAPLQKAGFATDSGAELVFKARAQAAHKTIHGFETLDKQVRLLAELPESVQVDFLQSTLKEFNDAQSALDQMVNAWAAGDMATLGKVVVEDMKTESPPIYEALLVKRNTDWADQIQTLLAGSGTAFIAVGAAHLAGDDSVQAILEKRGIDVERQ